MHPIGTSAAMNSKLLNFLVVLACTALIGLGAVDAQNPARNSDGNGSAISSPSRQADNASVAPASTPNGNDAHRAASADSRDAANTAVENDRGTLPENQAAPSNFHVAWIAVVGLLGLLGLLGLVRRSRANNIAEVRHRRSDDYRRAA